MADFKGASSNLLGSDQVWVRRSDCLVAQMRMQGSGNKMQVKFAFLLAYFKTFYISLMPNAKYQMLKSSKRESDTEKTIF